MENYDAVIAGAGIAGLTAGAFLRKAGKKVCIIEKTSDCGGLVTSFERKGFRYDGGVRALIDAGIITPMLDQLGIEMKTVPSHVTVGLGSSFVNIESKEDLASYGTLLRTSYPGNEEDVGRIIKAIKTVMKHMDVMYGIENPVFKDIPGDIKYLFGTLMPWLPRFLWTIRKIYSLGYPVEEYLKNLTGNSSLADIVGQHFFKNTPAFFAMSYFTLYLEYKYPLGGTGELSRCLEHYNRSHGTVIKTDTCGSILDPENRILLDQNGNAYRYKTLIWCADLKTLYRITEQDKISPRSTMENFLNRKEELESRKGGDSVFTLYLGTDLPPDYFSSKSRGHLFYTPEKQGLGETSLSELDTLKKSLKASSSSRLSVRKERVKAWLDKFFTYNTYEISIPSLRDRTMSPEKKTGLIISVLFSYELCRLTEQDGWFDEFRQYTEDRIISVMDRYLYSGLSGKIIDRFSTTPLTIENRWNSSDGAITGWSFENGPPPVVHRITKSASAVTTPLANVYQAGQWTYSPSGVPIAILTGKLAATAAVKNGRN